MARLSKTQIYAIRWLDHQKKNTLEISKELKIEEPKIISALEKNQTINSKNNIKTASSSSGNRAKNLMITQTSGKKNNSVAVMTKEASALGDSTRNSRPSRNTNKAIFRPNK